MATLEEVYQQVIASDAEKATFAEAAASPEALAAFLAERGCDAAPEEVAAFLKEKRAAQGELADAELDSVAGGCNGGEAYLSVITLGVSCAVTAILSSADGNMRGDDGKILCADINY